MMSGFYRNSILEIDMGISMRSPYLNSKWAWLLVSHRIAPNKHNRIVCLCKDFVCLLVRDIQFIFL